MVQKQSRHPRRSDDEWIALIHECRNSGMSDKAWCETKKIQPSNLYYHIRRLREKSCILPLTNHTATLQPKQEVVEIQMESLADTVTPLNGSSTEQEEIFANTSAIRISIGRCKVDISNSADSATIYNTLAALHNLC